MSGIKEVKPTFFYAHIDIVRHITCDIRCKWSGIIRYLKSTLAMICSFGKLTTCLMVVDFKQGFRSFMKLNGKVIRSPLNFL